MANADYEIVQGQLLKAFSEMHVEALSAETDLFESGILDSQRLVDLLLYIEQKFDTRFDAGDFEIETFRCVQKIAALILQRRNQNTSPQLTRAF